MQHETVETGNGSPLRELFPPRGVTPQILLTQVRNTVPWLLDGALDSAEEAGRVPFVTLLRRTERTRPEPSALSHAEYFRLCVSAHWATVASFVPTDVDNQIRFKLWHPSLELAVIQEMAGTVVESHGWSTTEVSTRWVASPETGERIEGHQGEWFSCAAAAYGALRRRSPEGAAEMAGLILREMQREARVFEDLRRARDGVGALKAATLIAHNLGDLDRVMEMWNLAPDDPLREAAFKAGEASGGPVLARGSLRATLSLAGKLNKAYMADENHRHFALRGPRCLRQSQDFLLPIGPFFDAWGTRLARHPALNPENVGEVVEALVDGWERLAKPVGYARAITGISEAFPGGVGRLTQYLPARVARTLKAGPLRTLMSVAVRRFEDQWSQMALQFRV